MLKIFSNIDGKLSKLTSKQKLAIMGGFSIIVFSIMLLFNIMTHIQGDDYIYLFKYSTFERVHSFNDLIQSQVDHYMLWGGRTVAHTIAQILLFFPPIVIDILNSLMFILFAVGLYLNARGNQKKHSISCFFLIVFLTWYMQPAFADTLLHVTGSANYLWCFTLSTFFILPYRLYENKKVSSGAVKAILMFLYGIIAGWTNENIALAIIVMLTLWIIYYKINKWAIPAWAYLGLLGSITGFLFMILAPGNYVRAAEMNMPTNLFYFSFRIRLHTLEFFQNTGLLNALILVLTVLALKFSKYKRRRFAYTLLIFLAGMLISLYAMVASPFFPPRAWLGIITFNIIIAGLVIFKLNGKERFLRAIVYGLVSLCLLIYPFSFYFAYKDMNAVHQVWQEREVEIAKAVNEKQDTIVFQSLGNSNRYVMGDYRNYEKYMSKYYKINLILEGAN